MICHMDIICIIAPRRREIASQLAAIRIQAGARGFLTRSQAEYLSMHISNSMGGKELLRASFFHIKVKELCLSMLKIRGWFM